MLEEFRLIEEDRAVFDGTAKVRLYTSSQVDSS